MKAMRAVVGEKGQVTIPKRLRERLGIGRGQVLEFREGKGELVVTKVLESDPVDTAYGSLAQYDAFPELSTDEFMELIRGPADLPDGSEDAAP